MLSLEKIAARCDFKNHKLNLYNLSLDDNDVPLIVAFLNENPSISELTIRYNNITAIGAKLLSTVQTILSLDASGNDFGDEGAQAIVNMKQLLSVDLGNNSLTSKGAIFLAQHHGLICVELANNAIDCDGIIPLAKKCHIKKLDVSRNNISKAGILQLSYTTSITNLDLSYNDLSDPESIRALANNKVIRKLNLTATDENNIGDIPDLAQNDTLRYLDLCNNRWFVFDNFANNHSLLALMLENCNLGNAAASKLLQMPLILTTIGYYWELELSTLQAIQKHIAHNRQKLFFAIMCSRLLFSLQNQTSLNLPKERLLDIAAEANLCLNFSPRIKYEMAFHFFAPPKEAPFLKWKDAILEGSWEKDLTQKNNF